MSANRRNLCATSQNVLSAAAEPLGGLTSTRNGPWASACIFGVTRCHGGDKLGWPSVSARGQPTAVPVAACVNRFRSLFRHDRPPDEFAGTPTHTTYETPDGLGSFLSFRREILRKRQAVIAASYNTDTLERGNRLDPLGHAGRQTRRNQDFPSGDIFRYASSASADYPGYHVGTLGGRHEVEFTKCRLGRAQPGHVFQPLFPGVQILSPERDKLLTH